jgi:hypothetical protein
VSRKDIEDILSAKRCIIFRGITGECNNKDCLNTACPLNHIYREKKGGRIETKR